MGDRRKCQTYTASPAEPGGLPVMLDISLAARWMWSPSCILEQSRFQPAIVCKIRVLLIASATVRFIGVAILWVPTASAPTGFVQRSW